MLLILPESDDEPTGATDELGMFKCAAACMVSPLNLGVKLPSIP